MVSLISALSGLIIAVALLLVALFLHRIAKPLGHALMNRSLNEAGKRLSRLRKWSDEGRAILSEPESEDP